MQPPVTLQPCCSHMASRLPPGCRHTTARWQADRHQIATRLQAVRRQTAGRLRPVHHQPEATPQAHCSHTVDRLLPDRHPEASSMRHATILQADSRQTLGSSRTGQQADCSQSVLGQTPARATPAHQFESRSSPDLDPERTQIARTAAGVPPDCRQAAPRWHLATRKLDDSQNATRWRSHYQKTACRQLCDKTQGDHT